jgi:cation:H+ antiporter
MLDLVIFLVGLVVLYYGAEWLIDAASQVALDYGIRPIVVGLTVVALGTSLPEFVINLFAAFDGEHHLALGNIIGSNICNVALILGTCALVMPLTVTPQMLRKEYPMMIGAMMLFYGLALDGVIGRADGVVLVVGLVGLLGFLFYDARRSPPELGGVAPLPSSSEAASPDEAPDEEAPSPQTVTGDVGAADALAAEIADVPGDVPRWRKTLTLVAGVIFLAVGARLMVFGAVNIAEAFGVEPVVIGLTIVAVGTSLPELAASMVGALKDEADLSVGNVMGSNLLNVLFVVGLVSLVSPSEMQVDDDALRLHLPVMLGFCLLLLPLAWTQYRIERWEGGVLLAGFFGYVAYLVMPYV